VHRIALVLIYNLRMTDTFAGKEMYKSFFELNYLEVYKAMHFAYDYNISLCVFV